MDTCSKINFLQGHYNIVKVFSNNNIVKVFSNNSVIFTRFSYLVMVYICLKPFKFSSIKDKTRHQNTDILQHFLVVNTSKCT